MRFIMRIRLKEREILNKKSVSSGPSQVLLAYFKWGSSGRTNANCLYENVVVKHGGRDGQWLVEYTFLY